MNDSINLMIRDDGVATIYDDTYDITIHCENEEEQRKVVELLKSIPSAQPEIIYCKDCKHHWTHSCMDAFPREICDLDQTFYDSSIDYCSLAERRKDG